MASLFGSGCPKPFLLESDYPPTGGDIEGRTCAPVPVGLSGKSISCCLPCLTGRWYYSDNIIDFITRCQWLNVVGVILLCFLLLSFFVLPTEKTRRHYLSTCLIIAVLSFNLAYVVPQAREPTPCYNDITPNDFHSDATCFATTLSTVGGGWAVVMWVFLRSLALHLQICWQFTTGFTFFVVAQFMGWVIPIMMTIAAFYVSGSSYLLTGSCNIRGNHNDVAVLWGPVMAISVLTAGIQSATCLYCTRIFLRAVFEDRPPTESSSLPQYARSGHSRTTGASARQAYRRMIRVMQLQWRSILFVLVLISDVILFAAIFIAQDSKTAAAKANPQLVQSWLLCLITHAGDKNACLDRTGAIAVKSSAIATEYFMIGITGWWTLALLGRGSMFSGWCDVIKSLWGVCTGCFSRRNQKDERISYVTSPTGRKHEVLHSSSSKRTGATVIKEGSESTIHTPTTAGFSPPMVQRSSPKPHQGSDVSPPTSTGEGEHDPPSDPEKGAVAARKSLRPDKPRYVAPQQSSARSNGSSDRLHPSVLAAYNQRPLPDPPQEADEPEPERERREYESLPEALVVHEAPAYTSRAGTPMARREELEMGERHEVPTSANSYSRTEPPWGRREVGPGEVDGSRRYAEGERVRYM